MVGVKLIFGTQNSFFHLLPCKLNDKTQYQNSSGAESRAKFSTKLTETGAIIFEWAQQKIVVLMHEREWC